MHSTLTLALLQQAADRYLQVRDEILPSWNPLCQCPSPGQSRQCQQCPDFRGFILRLQQRLAHLEPGEEQSLPLCLTPVQELPYSDEMKQQAIWLYKQRFSVLEIQRLTGVSNKRFLRAWLYEAGLLRKQGDYSEQEREHALALYKTGLTPQQVEAKTGISADAVGHWATERGVSRAKANYSVEQRQRSLELYQEGKTLAEIAAETHVHGPTVCAWAKAMGLERPRKKRGRPKVHSDEVQQRCVDSILKGGKTVVQVEAETGISASTLRNWLRAVQRD